MSVRELVYWLLHGVNATLVSAGVSSRPFVFVGLLFNFFLAAILLVMTITKRGVMRGTPTLIKVAYAGLVALWLPTFVFGVWPDIQYNRIAFNCLASILSVGVGVTMATCPFIGRYTR